MSVQQLALVFERSRAENAERLVLLSLANHAGGDGGDAYPSIATIAREARIGESTVRLALKRLKALGEIVENDLPSQLGTRSFRLTLPDAPAPDRSPSRRPWQTPAGSGPPADPAPPQDLDPRRSWDETPQDLAPAPAGSAPEPSLTVHEPTTSLRSVGAREPQPDEISARVPDHLHAVAEHVRGRLAELAAAKGVDAPTLRRVAEIVADFPDHDHHALAGDVVDYWRDGAGARTQRKDLARVYRDWCGRSVARRGRRRPGPSRVDGLRALHAEALAEEAATR